MIARAFFYLSWCSFRNRIRVRLRRLKQPRYLVGLLFGLVYMWWFFIQPLFFRSRGGSRSATAAASAFVEMAGPILAVGSVLLLLFAALAWLWPGKRPALMFTRPEVQFLFQAPLTRRQLVHYRLIRSQVGNLFGSLIMTLISRPTSIASGWTTAVGLWVVFSIMSLHGIGISLSHQNLRRTGWQGLSKQWLPVTLLGGAMVVVVTSLAMHWSTLASAGSIRASLTEAHRLLTSGAVGIVLWPFRAMLQVPLAPTVAAFWIALPWSLLILAVNYVWVLRADVAFEEASAAQAEKTAVRLAEIRAGKISAPKVRSTPRMFSRKAMATATPFSLALTGRPEFAILWKNLIMVSRYFSLKVLWRFLPFGIVLLIGISASEKATWLVMIGAACVVGLGLTIMVGPQMARNDLRQDLAQLSVLKTWPISGPALLRGELAAPALSLTVAAWAFAIVGIVVFASITPKGELQSLTLMNKLSYGLSVMLVAPGVILAQLVVQNGMAIMFPAWVPAGGARAAGLEATGQRLLMLAANLITIVLSLVPGAIVGGLIGWLVYWKTGVVIVLVPALILCVFMLAQCWLAVEGLGRLLERTDVTEIDATET